MTRRRAAVTGEKPPEDECVGRDRLEPYAEQHPRQARMRMEQIEVYDAGRVSCSLAWTCQSLTPVPRVLAEPPPVLPRVLRPRNRPRPGR